MFWPISSPKTPIELNLHRHSLALGTAPLTDTSYSWQHCHSTVWVAHGRTVVLLHHPDGAVSGFGRRPLSVSVAVGSPVHSDSGSRRSSLRQPVCHWSLFWFIRFWRVFSFAKLYRLAAMPSTAGYFTPNCYGSLPQIAPIWVFRKISR